MADTETQTPEQTQIAALQAQIASLQNANAASQQQAAADLAAAREKANTDLRVAQNQIDDLTHQLSEARKGVGKLAAAARTFIAASGGQAPLQVHRNALAEGLNDMKVN